MPPKYNKNNRSPKHSIGRPIIFYYENKKITHVNYCQLIITSQLATQHHLS
jgi:hypothetical protein